MDIPYRIGLQQRVLPIYRQGFFDLLASSCAGGLSIFAGEGQPGETITSISSFTVAEYRAAQNFHLFRGKFYLCWQTGLLQWLKEWDPDVLIMEANPRYLHTPAAIRWMHRHHRPVLGWGLGTGGHLPPGSIESKLWRRFLLSLDGVIAYSQSGAVEYAEAGVPVDSIFVAPNAVLSAPVAEPERSAQFSVDGAVILFVGRLQARKKVDLLIRACAAIHAHQNIQLWIIGDGPELSSLVRLAEEILPHTQFMGTLHGEASAVFFKQADLFVLPGTGGLAVQEAMSYGLPVIVGEADGTQSSLVSPENGWVLDNGSVENLVETIQSALDKPERLREMGRRSFEITTNEVNIEKMTEVFSSAIHFVMEQRKL